MFLLHMLQRHHAGDVKEDNLKNTAQH